MRRYTNSCTLQIFIAVVLWATACGTLAASALDSPRSANPQAIPFARYANYIWLPVRVNGSAPLQFVLDTGASTCIISQRTANLLGIEIAGQRHEPRLGTGEKSSTVGLAKNVVLGIAGIEIQKKEMVVVPLELLEQAVGHRIDGILGSEFFEHYVVVIDYAKGEVALHGPRDYKYVGDGQPLPIELKDVRPFVRAVVAFPGAAPIEGLFAIDTGANGSISLHSRFVENHHLLSVAQKTIEHSLHGAAGEAPERIAQADRLQLGTIVIEHPDVGLSVALSGSTADSTYDGAIGGEVLRRFKVILIYSKKQIILETTPALAQAFDLDMSGASLIAAGPDFKKIVVEHVLANSPISEAGVRVGDVITAIGGNPAADYPLDRLREMFKREGQEYQLEIQRGDQTLRVKIKLRRLI